MPGCHVKDRTKVWCAAQGLGSGRACHPANPAEAHRSILVLSIHQARLTRLSLSPFLNVNKTHYEGNCDMYTDSSYRHNEWNNWCTAHDDLHRLCWRHHMHLNWLPWDGHSIDWCIGSGRQWECMGLITCTDKPKARINKFRVYSFFFVFHHQNFNRPQTWIFLFWWRKKLTFNDGDNDT